MASKTYTVTIKNGSGDTSGSRRYFVYFEAPTVGGGSGRNAFPLVFYQTQLLSNGGRITINYTSELFGYIGTSSSTSSSLKAGDTVALTSANPVRVGDKTGDGKVLEVRPDQDDIQLTLTDDNDSAKGTFTINTMSRIAYPNTYVTGLARDLQNIGEVPTAALPVVAGQTFILTPKHTLYVVKGEDKKNSVVTTALTDENSQKIEFPAGQTTAVVTNTTVTGGKSGFTITYS